MENLKYIIIGQPVSFTKVNYASNLGPNTTKELRLIWEITLQGQHEGKAIITTELEVFFDFFFDETIRCRHPNHHMRVTPTISDLIKFACEMATGIIWTDSRLIVKTHAEKYYSKEPRTELTVIRIGSHGKNHQEYH
jgi:Holliday junction resolvase RusA-like endonuclease